MENVKTIAEVRAAEEVVADYVEEVPVKAFLGQELRSLIAALRRFRPHIIPVFKNPFSHRPIAAIYPHTFLLLQSHKDDRPVREFANENFRSVRRGAPVEEVYRELTRDRPVPGVLVLDEEGAYVGAATPLSLLRYLLAKGAKPRARSVAAVYTSPSEGYVMFVNKDERISSYVKRIVGGDVFGAVVLSEEGGAMGVVTIWELVRVLWMASRFVGARKVKAVRGLAAAEPKRVGAPRSSTVMLRGVPAASPDTPIEQVAEFMARTGIELVPVEDESGRVIGAVTVYDVLRAYLVGPKEGRVDVEVRAVAEEALPRERIERERTGVLTGIRAGQIAVQDLPIVHVNDAASRIRKVFLRSGSRYVFVVDDSGRVVGIISRRDLITYLARTQLRYWKLQKGRRIIVSRDFAAIPRGGEQVQLAVREGTAGEIMRRDIPIVDASTSVEEVAYVMASSGSDAVLVKRGDEVIGVIGRDELLRVFIERGRDVSASEVMTPISIASVNSGQSIHKAINIINMYDLDAVAVVRGREVAGLIDVEDLALVPVEESFRGEKLLFLTIERRGRRVVRLGLIPVDMVAREPAVVRVGDSARAAARVMLERGIAGVVVVDDAGNPVGVVSKAEIVRELARGYARVVVEAREAERVEAEAKPKT